MTSLIVGARTEEQLVDNLAAADLRLSDEERARLDEVSRPPLLYPYWHQAKTAADRLECAGPVAAGGASRRLSARRRRIRRDRAAVDAAMERYIAGFEALNDREAAAEVPS